MHLQTALQVSPVKWPVHRTDAGLAGKCFFCSGRQLKAVVGWFRVLRILRPGQLPASSGVCMRRCVHDKGCA